MSMLLINAIKAVKAALARKPFEGNAICKCGHVSFCPECVSIARDAKDQYYGEIGR